MSDSDPDSARTTRQLLLTHLQASWTDFKVPLLHQLEDRSGGFFQLAQKADSYRVPSVMLPGTRISLGTVCDPCNENLAHNDGDMKAILTIAPHMMTHAR